MAVDPLFFDTRAEILTHVRMSDMCADASAQTLIDRALLKIRTELYSKLGSTKIATLQAEAYTEAPTTDSEMDRARAQLIECEWLQAELLCILPILFAEGGKTGIDIYQDENPFRLTEDESRDKLREKLLESVSEMLEDLGTTDTKQSFRAAIVDPECQAPSTLHLLTPYEQSLWNYTPN
jgi:hypothetical protein